jgi:hypothetical protein
MEVYQLSTDIRVFCVRAKSFPNDIGQAFGALIRLLPSTDGRTFFGVSRQDEKRHMVYDAAVLESFEGEGKKYGCETFIIKKGSYLTETLRSWKKTEGSIGLTFRKLADARKDTVFPCVDWYQGDDVLCMVRIDPHLTTVRKNTYVK